MAKRWAVSVSIGVSVNRLFCPPLRALVWSALVYDCSTWFACRPYPEWWHKRNVFNPVEREERTAVVDAPSHWDYVLKRIEDILVDNDDMMRTRAIMFDYMDMMLSVYDYYSGLTNRTVVSWVSKFAPCTPSVCDNLPLVVCNYVGRVLECLCAAATEHD
eukprot:SAG31_NODE_3370_length_4353_cov_5.039962_7_plen_160_part_00